MSAVTDFKESFAGRIVVGVLTALDKFVNGLLNGDFQHTVSAYYGLHAPTCWLCSFLDKYVERDHCRKAARNEGLL